MSLPRPTLKLDEKSFQDLLAAAYTIQEHNAKRKRGQETPRFCSHCGSPVKDDQSLCGRCGVEQFRPGERLQRNWASLWLMSQQQDLRPERFSEKGGEAVETPASQPTDLAEQLLGVEDETIEAPDQETETALASPGAPADWDQAAMLIEATPPADSFLVEADDPNPSPRFDRADLYLIVAIIVSTVAMIWVLAGAPAPGAQRKPRLRPWEQALVSLGIAEAPPPVTRADHGNPNAQVWVDPHTALYYCAGEDPYGKTPDGRVTTQKEAQMDQFEPAARAACD
jgi:ribosomal protein S27AE